MSSMKRTGSGAGLSKERIHAQWLSEEELAAIYRNGIDRISAPLRITCERIFGLRNEREE